ncbi:MAG: hypothetical protein KDE50_35360, partial [Caldilineaceae bacterium]|nr:hypothetical protein [Caldilineaceae bacterium]
TEVDDVTELDDVTEVDDDEQIVTTARPLAENISAAEQPNRIITATPQAHAELAELIARLEELERKADARFAADAKSGSVDVVHVDTQDNTNADRANDDHVDGNINDEVGHIEHNVEHYVEHAVEHTVEHNLDIAEDATATPFPPEKREVRGEAAAQNAATPSNLREISGIGKTYETRLHAGGIHTWQQVAESDVETLQLLTNARAVDVANWITHAAALMRQQQPPSANNPTTA